MLESDIALKSIAKSKSMARSVTGYNQMRLIARCLNLHLIPHGSFTLTNS